MIRIYYPSRIINCLMQLGVTKSFKAFMIIEKQSLTDILEARSIVNKSPMSHFSHAKKQKQKPNPKPKPKTKNKSLTTD